MVTNRYRALLVIALSTACALPLVACKKGGTEAPAPPFAVGDKVEVEWKGEFYQAQILSKTGGLFRVHYIGFGTKWDETVSTARMRAFTGKGKVGA